MEPIGKKMITGNTLAQRGTKGRMQHLLRYIEHLLRYNILGQKFVNNLIVICG
jgi:hypothetical protein